MSNSRTALLSELQALAAQVTGEEVILVEGEAGASWSWNWRERVITVSPDFLNARSADVCRAILLHESAHCAITRIHHLMEGSKRRLYQDLLNVLEDLRIEAWLAEKFPGCGPWLHTANDLIFRSIAGHPWPSSLQLQFLRALLEQAHSGHAPAGLHPRVLDALTESRAAVVEQTKCHPLIAVGRAAARETLNAQQRMLVIFDQKIRHVWERLVAIDESEGRQRITTIIGGFDGHSPGASLQQRLQEAGHLQGSAHGTNGGDPQGETYLARQRRLAPLIDQLAEEFLRVFATTSRDAFQRRRNCGHRIEMCLAMQSEADPRLLDQIWMRRHHHTRFDPLVVLALDCSASMQGAKFNAAFDGIVMLSEVCLRTGLPMALWTFNSETRSILRPHGQCDSEARRRLLDQLRSQCGGGTVMASALGQVFASPEIHQFSHPLVFVIGDGCPSDIGASRAQIARFSAADIPIFGLGIGPETQGMKSFFPNSIVGLDVRKILPALCHALRQTLHQMLPASPHRRAA